METKTNVYLLYILLCIGQVLTDHVYANNATTPHQHDGSIKLFVFGDSYVDTGNWEKSSAASWKEPYGITFPGKPSGRFSDGRVLTDYIASFLGIKSPVPFAQWKSAANSSLEYGMNFAYGGTGVFDTGINGPNMESQIKFFEQLLEQKVPYTKHDLDESSIALVSLAGNDYTTYFEKNGNVQDLAEFTKTLINQLSMNLRRIHKLGVRKIAVAGLQPLGCMPRLTVLSSYQNCSEKWNAVSMFHNQILHQEVQRLNNESGNHTFEVLDLFSAFMSALNQSHHAGTSELKGPLKPCCLGVGSNFWCGNIDSSGVKKYIVCNNTESSIFWDMAHPSQNGWHLVYLALKPSSPLLSYQEI